MNLCRHCGVEVEDEARACPLCRQPLQPGAEGAATESAQPAPAAQEASRSVRRWVLEAFSLLAVTSAVVLFAADFATGLALSWARYPLASIGFAWLAAFLPTVCARRAWLYLPAEIAAAALFLFVLDWFTPGSPWFLPLALPLTLLIGTMLALTLAIGRKLRLSPFAAIAAAILAAGLFVMGLELLLNRYRDHRWLVSWSAVAFVCALPLVALLLYLRMWLGRRQAEIRKLLHL